MQNPSQTTVYNMDSTDKGEYAYQQVSFNQSISDNEFVVVKKVDEAKAFKDDVEGKADDAGKDDEGWELVEAPKKESLVGVLRYQKDSENLGQWCKV